MVYARRILALTAVIMVLLPYGVFAQQQPQRGLPTKIVPCTGVDCKCQDLITLGQNIINAGIFIAVFLSAILFAYAGWLYLSNEAIGQQQKAKKVFSNVAIGLIIVLSAWLIVNTLLSSMLKDSIVWTNICENLGL